MIAKCPCEHCGENIEFATEDFLPGGRVACPHCGVETAIYISSPSLISKSVAPASASPQNQPDAIKGRAWYYSQDGKRIGPCNESQIHTLIATHTIRLDSLVWCEGMSDWTAANRTDIRHFFGSATMPPPLTGESVNNGIVWTLAFAPILGAFLEAILAAVTESPEIYFCWVSFLLNTALCLADALKLKNAGHDKIMSLWVFLVPVYLFIRASRLKQSNGYAVVWLAMFFLSLFI